MLNYETNIFNFYRQFKYCLLGLALFQVGMMFVVLSVIVHYNARKHRWSIIKIVDKKNNRVVPEPVEARELMPLTS